MGASRLLVRATVRISPLFRSSFAEEMAIWVEGGGVAFARLISAPLALGEDGRLDIVLNYSRGGMEGLGGDAIET